MFAGADEWRIKVVQLLSDTSLIPVFNAACELFVVFSIQRLREAALVAAIEWQFGVLKLLRWWYKHRVCKIGWDQIRSADVPDEGYWKHHQLLGWLVHWSAIRCD